MSKKKILVAVDGSEYSDLVVDEAIEFVKVVDGTIILVYCHKKFPSSMAQPYQEDVISHIVSEAEKVVNPFLKKIKAAAVSVEDRIMEEPAGSAISDIARIEKCDLIIMGSRGLTNLASLIVGSVTNRVLQTAPCSVLVVR